MNLRSNLSGYTEFVLMIQEKQFNTQWAPKQPTQLELETTMKNKFSSIMKR